MNLPQACPLRVAANPLTGGAGLLGKPSLPRLSKKAISYLIERR
jgi:hypothetical protein